MHFSPLIAVHHLKRYEYLNYYMYVQLLENWLAVLAIIIDKIILTLPCIIKLICTYKVTYIVYRINDYYYEYTYVHNMQMDV